MAQGKEATALRKLSIKAVCGEQDIEEIIKRKKIDLMDVFGIATRMKTVESEYGVAVRFIGKFRAVNLATGEIFESSRMYLPSAMEEELSAAMGQGVNAKFALRINVNFDKSLATKYYYDCVNLVEPQNSDELDALQLTVKEAVKSLPAPSKKGG